MPARKRRSYWLPDCYSSYVGLRVLCGIYMFLLHQWIVEDVPDSSHLNHNGSIAQEIAQRSQPGGHLKRDRSGDIFSMHRGINDSVSS